MKKMVKVLLIAALFLGVACFEPIKTQAAGNKEVIPGKTYDLGEKDAYDLNKIEAVSDSANRFYVNGDIDAVSTKNGFTSYAVKNGNLKIFVDDSFAKKLFTPDSNQDWHIITDKTKQVDSAKLSSNIGSGAVVVQTSRDGKAWVTIDSETDIYNKMDSINKRSIAGEEIKAFYETTNIQIANGCYYRLIVAYKLEREVDPSKFLFITTKNTEAKERVEIYQFYAYNPDVKQTEVLDKKNAYEFGDVYRVNDQDGFDNPEKIKSDDPHIDWSVGKFYVSGYTKDIKDSDGETPIFLKVPGDKAALWFNLEQQIDKCNNRTDIKINDIASGSDINFGTPTINNVGRGMLIIRKTDNKNQKERQIYTNYLEASASFGANTRVDLFEEGDYEVALDYQLHYDKPFVFGTTTTKTLTYRIAFKFKVRNGDISAFIRDTETNQFIKNGNVAEKGFYIDVANSKYLDLHIERYVLTEGLDDLVEDVKFSGEAQEGRHYTEEGIYTVRVTNEATKNSIEKTIYVGNRDIMRAHMATGMSISEINERIAAGAYIDANGNIVDPEPEPEPEPEVESESEAESQVSSEEHENKSEVKEEPQDITKENSETNTNVGKGGVNQETSAEVVTEPNSEKKGIGVYVVLAVILVAGGTTLVMLRKKSGTTKKKEDSEL